MTQISNIRNAAGYGTLGLTQDAEYKVAVAILEAIVDATEAQVTAMLLAADLSHEVFSRDDARKVYRKAIKAAISEGM